MATSTLPGSSTRLRLTPRAELVTTLLGSWLMIGLFVDGWAHNNRPELETFFTPWHALFYSGFLATAGWILWQTERRRSAGTSLRQAAPVGYGLALVGIVLFAAGGVGDLLWHEVFGIEQNIDALFSPTHIVLFAGVALILSAPLRAAWTADPPATPASYRDFLPVTLSLALVATLCAFMFMYLGVFSYAVNVPTSANASTLRDGGVGFFWDSSVIASFLVTTALTVVPVLLAHRRWRPPFGLALTVFGLLAVLSGAIDEFALPERIPAALLAGLAVDLLAAVLRPSPAEPRRFWLFGAVAPALLWSVVLAVLALTEGIGWPVEMWTGIVVWAGLLGLGIALLMLLPEPATSTTATPSDRPERERLSASTTALRGNDR